MKLPKKVNICGAEWTVRPGKKAGGGNFWSSKKLITVGTKTKYTDDIFLHEVIEAIFANRGMRYCKYLDCREYEYRFVFTHEEFENAIRDIAAALRLKLK
jgi:lipopolysaccharide biosynthesis protein